MNMRAIIEADLIQLAALEDAEATRLTALEEAQGRFNKSMSAAAKRRNDAYAKAQAAQTKSLVDAETDRLDAINSAATTRAERLAEIYKDEQDALKEHVGKMSRHVCRRWRCVAVGRWQRWGWHPSSRWWMAQAAAIRHQVAVAARCPTSCVRAISVASWSGVGRSAKLSIYRGYWHS